MNAYIIPTLVGALIAFLVRYFAGSGLTTAVIGAFVVVAICAVLFLLGRTLRWHRAPMLHAGIATIASTLAFLLTRAPQ